MEGQRSLKSLLICFLCAGLLSLSPVACTSRSLEGSSIKPDCDCGTPSHGHGGHHATPVPSHGSGGSYGTPAPSHGSSGTPSAPSHGGGGYYGTPSPSQGSSGSHGTPDPTHGTPTHGSGGSYGTPTVPSYTTPTAPTHGGSYGTPTVPSYTTPTAPSHGGSYGTPTVPSYTTPTTPSHGSGGYYGTPVVVPPPTSTTPVVEPPAIPTPSIPVITPPVVSTPDIPVGPTIPGISTPSPPLVPVDPHIPFFMPGTCNYWSTHPQAIWAIFGYWGTVGEYFGASCASAFGTNPSLQDALKNPRTDGIGALYREGTAAFLNSMVCTKYALTTPQVTHAFAAAVSSNKKAAVQAELFKKANEGRVMKA